jgi:hypothetical protein
LSLRGRTVAHTRLVNSKTLSKGGPSGQPQNHFVPCAFKSKLLRGEIMAQDQRFKVPKAVQDNAKKALELHEAHGRGGTDVGVQMAQKLSSGADMSAEDVLHVAKYFPRHSGDNLDEDGKNGKAPSNGFIAWMLWGGDAGRDWSESTKTKIEGQA